MQILVQMVKHNDTKNNLSLQYNYITDLSNFIPLLQKLPNLQYLSLHGNKIKFIPSNLSKLQQLKQFDLSQNLIKINSKLVDSLYTLPKLQNLKIDGTTQQMQFIAQHLPKLKILNKKEVIVIRQEITDHSQRDLGIKQLRQQAQKVKNLEKQLLATGFKDNSAKYDELYFQNRVKDIIRQFQQFSEGVNNKTSKQGVKLYAINRLYEYGLDTTIEQCLTAQGVQSPFLTLIEKINEIKSQNFNNLLKIVLQIGYQQCLNMEKAQNQVPIRRQKLYLKEITRLNECIIQLRTSVNELQILNDSYLQKINSIKNRDKKSINVSRNFTPRGTKQINIEDKKLGNSSSNSSIIKRKRQKEINRTHKNLQNSKIMQRSIDRKKSYKLLTHQIAQSPKNQDKNDGKLSIQTTLNLISQIIKDKRIHNNKCIQKRQQFETMQDFIYNFFERKYGLKQLALNSTLKLIKSIEKYSKQNSLILTFGKILKHKVQENFFEKQKDFQTNIYNTIKHNKLTLNYVERLGRSIMNNKQQQITSQKLSKLNLSDSRAVAYALTTLHLYYHQQYQIKDIIKILIKYDSNQDGKLTKQQARLAIDQFKKQLQDEYKIFEFNNILQQCNPFKLNRIIFSVIIENILLKIN